MLTMYFKEKLHFFAISLLITAIRSSGTHDSFFTSYAIGGTTLAIAQLAAQHGLPMHKKNTAYKQHSVEKNHGTSFFLGWQVPKQQGTGSSSNF